MKRRILIAFAVGVLLSLTSFAIPAQWACHHNNRL